MGKHYYTASEARAKLGLSKSMFFRKVKQELIPKEVLPGMTHGVYPKRDIDALALSLHAKIEDFVFSRSTPADQVEEMNIGIRCFGHQFVTPLAERISFQQKSDFTFHSLKVRGKVVGYVSMFRLPEGFLDALLTGRSIETEITIKEVLPFVRLTPFSIYVDIMAVDPILPPHLRRLYAGMIVFHSLVVIDNLLTNNYQLTRLYTVITNKEGESLAQKIGFQQIGGKSIVPGRTAYEYPLEGEGLQRLHALRQRFHSHLHLYFQK